MWVYIQENNNLRVLKEIENGNILEVDRLNSIVVFTKKAFMI